MKHIFAAVLGAVIAFSSVDGLMAVVKPVKKTERARAKNSRHHDSCSSSSSSSSSSGCCGCDCS